MRRLSLLIAALLLGGAAGPALAIPFEDPATGFKVDPPPPYFVQPARSTTYDEAVVIKSTTNTPPTAPGDPYLCQIGLKKAADPGALTQAAINDQVGQPDFLANAAAAFAQTFDVSSQATFTQQGATGIELVGTSKTGDGTGIFVSLVDTPIGRTSLNCVTPAAQLDNALAPFRQIRNAITLPTKAAP